MERTGKWLLFALGVAAGRRDIRGVGRKGEFASPALVSAPAPTPAPATSAETSECVGLLIPISSASLSPRDSRDLLAALATQLSAVGL